MQKDAREPVAEVRADGGAARNGTLMRFQADLLGVPVLRPKVRRPRLGAAYLAGPATGFRSSREEIAALWQCEHRFDPVMSTDRREALLARSGRAVECAQAWELAL